MVSGVFINLPVKDLKKTVAFFKRLGFKFNPQFTNDEAAAMIIGKNMHSMLITEKRFKDFTKKKISDAKRNTEVLIALQVESRKKVDEVVKKAVAAGGKLYRDAEDHGWMYGKAFADLDGHQWEVFYINSKAVPKKP
jgi:uncharacterized protein